MASKYPILSLIHFKVTDEDRVTLATGWVNGTPFIVESNGAIHCLQINDLKKEDGSNQKFIFEATSVVIYPPNNSPEIREEFKYTGYFDNTSKSGWIKLVR